jgi:hypothetical protein
VKICLPAYMRYNLGLLEVVSGWAIQSRILRLNGVYEDATR